MTNKYRSIPQPDYNDNYRAKYMEAVALRQDASFAGRFNGPHVLTDNHGWTARCCGNAEGCKWCANEAAYMGGASQRQPYVAYAPPWSVAEPPNVAVVEPSEFMECDTCRAKPGSPTLCHGCLHNRDVISQYRRANLTRDFNVGRPSAPRWTAEPPSLAGYYWFYWGSCKAETAWMVELQDTGKWHSTYFDPGYSTEYLTQMNGRWWPVKIDPPTEDSE
jgi:hypothetical protein